MGEVLRSETRVSISCITSKSSLRSSPRALVNSSLAFAKNAISASFCMTIRFHFITSPLTSPSLIFFITSSSALQISGNSETWQNKLDVDVPLRMDLLGHELRSGGFFSRMDLYDGVRDGLNSDYVYEAHGRLVMDFLGQLWKVQWIGVGASRYWGQGLTGWSYGVDVAFRF